MSWVDGRQVLLTCESVFDSECDDGSGGSRFETAGP